MPQATEEPRNGSIYRHGKELSHLEILCYLRWKEIETTIDAKVLANLASEIADEFKASGVFLTDNHVLRAMQRTARKISAPQPTQKLIAKLIRRAVHATYKSKPKASHTLTVKPEAVKPEAIKKGWTFQCNFIQGEVLIRASAPDGALVTLGCGTITASLSHIPRSHRAALAREICKRLNGYDLYAGQEHFLEA